MEQDSKVAMHLKHSLKYANHLHDAALVMNHAIAMEQDSKAAMHLKAFTEVCQPPA